GNFYDMLGLFLMFLILLKVVLAMKHTISTLNDPIVASVSPTFTMYLMVLSVFLKRLSGFSPLANVIWWTSLILHLILMMYF
ncbi:TDT family transporter, partial [Lactococcus lactis]